MLRYIKIRVEFAKVIGRSASFEIHASPEDLIKIICV